MNCKIILLLKRVDHSKSVSNKNEFSEISEMKKITTWITNDKYNHDTSQSEWSCDVYLLKVVK